jgi:hypothetical protein
VDRELRPGIAGLEPPWLGPDALAEAVAIDQLLDPHTRGIEAVEQAKVGQLLHRVRQKADPHAKLTDLGRLLEDLDLHTPLVQAQRGRKPADAAADYQGLHCLPLRSLEIARRQPR